MRHGSGGQGNLLDRGQRRRLQADAQLRPGGLAGGKDRPAVRRVVDEQNSVRQQNKPKQKKIKFDPKRFRELENEIKRLEDLRPEIETEFQNLTTKGKVVRAEKRKKRLESIDKQLEVLYDEWLILGEKKKKW